MNNTSPVEFEDLQGLVRFGYGKLTDTSFLLLNIADVETAKQWLATAPVSHAAQADAQLDSALQIAFTKQGLCDLGLDAIIDDFSDEFKFGMTGDGSRSRRLGDVEANSPEKWEWGGQLNNTPHILLLLYAKPGGMETWQKKVQGNNFSKAFKILKTLPTLDIGQIEPFGFADGISQPKIDWAREQSTDPHERVTYSNLMAIGEVLLGYPNEYSQYTVRPLIDPKNDKLAVILPNAEDNPALKDFGRNGSYLVLRQLGQDVPGFWQYVDKAAGSEPKKREQLAAAMVGRNRDGTPLVSEATEDIPGVPAGDRLNQFNYNEDPHGQKCPVSAHIRRANPRTGDLPPPVSGLFSWLKKSLGFGLSYPEEDLIASTRYHRLLRRGRSYGPKLAAEEAVKPGAPQAERGLQFICLVANIQRQFEFVQNAWMMNSKFAGLQQERDPLLGRRDELLGGQATDHFHRPDPAGPMQKLCPLPQFITVRGGAYFFMPGIRALKYIAAQPTRGSGNKS